MALPTSKSGKITKQEFFDHAAEINRIAAFPPGSSENPITDYTAARPTGIPRVHWVVTQQPMNAGPIDEVVITSATSLPSAPTGISIAQSGTTATLTWSPPLSTGSATITAYRISRMGADAAGSTSYVAEVAESSRSATFTNLVTGSTYTLNVAAITSVGTGPVASQTVTIGANIVYSESFSLTAGGWAARVNASNVIRDTTRASAGSLRWTATSATTTSAAQGPIVTGLKSNTSYTLTSRLSHSATGTREMRTVIDCIDASGNLTGGDSKYAGTYNVPTGTGFFEATLTFTTDATTTQARIWSQAWNSVTNPIAAGDNFYVDEVRLVENPVSTTDPGTGTGTTTGGTTGTAPMPYPAKALAIYHMMWSTSNSPPLANLPTNANVVNLAFAQGSPPTLTGWASDGETQFITSAKQLRARGCRVLLSVGGAGGALNVAARQTFVDGVMAINAKVPLDGIDWDPEGPQMVSADVLWITNELKRLRGSNFAVTMAPNGSNKTEYRTVAVALNNAGQLDMIGQQYYDAPITEATMLDNLTNFWVAGGIPSSKLALGYMLTTDTADANHWTIDTAISRTNAAKARYSNLKGGYLWEHGNSQTSAWASRVGPLLLQ